MLEEAYAYGLTPKEAAELSLAEMASFVTAKRKEEMRQYKVLARIGYLSGIVASSTLSKRKPRFDELYDFPEDSQRAPNVELLKAQMIVWAQNVNRMDRKNRRGGKTSE